MTYFLKYIDIFIIFNTVCKKILKNNSNIINFPNKVTLKFSFYAISFYFDNNLVIYLEYCLFDFAKLMIRFVSPFLLIFCLFQISHLHT